MYAKVVAAGSRKRVYCDGHAVGGTINVDSKKSM